MTNTEKLQTLRDHQAWRMGGDGAMTPPKDLTVAIEYAIRCCESIQSLAKILRHDEIMVPGIYLSKTAAGEIVPMTIRQELIDAGHVYKGLAYQGPIEWVEG